MREKNKQPTTNEHLNSSEPKAFGKVALSLVKQQRNNEQTYRYNLAASEALDSETYPTPDEITHRLELDHVIKEAPFVEDQLVDKTRTNMITFIRERESLGVATSHVAGEKYSMTEHEALSDLIDYVDTANSVLGEGPAGDRFPSQIKYLAEELTFIGKKEYDEAATGIATYWKTLLDQNPSLQILVLSRAADSLKEDTEETKVKSGDYLLDTILMNFSDEEVGRYADRLIFDAQDVTVREARNLRSVLLDDWVLSGNQISGAARKFKNEHPEWAQTLEVQLIAAGRGRLATGLETRGEDYMPDGAPSLPVKAYFMAHEASFSESSDAIITGAHSTVDFDFEYPLAEVAMLARGATNLTEAQHARLDTMPAMTNIVRPYRTSEVRLTQRKRFEMAHRHTSI